MSAHDVVRQLLNGLFLVLQSRRDDIPNQNLDGRAVDRRLHLIRMQVALVSIGRFRAHPVSWKPGHEIRRHSDGVDHPPPGVTGMSIETLELHGNGVGREAFELELSTAPAIERVCARGAESLDVKMVGAAADL